jgi:hypothetical protein
VGYELGRILTAIPNTAFVTGAMYDYTDTIALKYSVGHGLLFQAAYFDHQRSVVTGQCLNQKKCIDAAGGELANPLSIDEHGYTFGFGLDFGPKTRVGPLFNASGDIKYIPRPATPSSPAVALGSLPGYRGTQTLYPWSFTLRIPLTTSPTLVPTVTYISLPVLYRDSAVPEAYRGIIIGVSKAFSKNITFSYTNFNLLHPARPGAGQSSSRVRDHEARSAHAALIQLPGRSPVLSMTFANGSIRSSSERR